MAAGHSRWARTEDRKAATRPGRAAFMRRFEDRVDPERKLDPAERARRAEGARQRGLLGRWRRIAEELRRQEDEGG